MPEKAGLRLEIPDSEILDHASPHVINSAQLAVFEKSFAFEAGLMRQCDGLLGGPIFQEMGEGQQELLQPSRPTLSAPVLRTLEDVDNHIHSFRCAAYFVNKEFRVQFSNQAARNFADADPFAPGKSVAELNDLVVTEYLSFPSFSRLPGKDFLSLQTMLGHLALIGYDLPPVKLKLARKRDGRMMYLGVTIDAKYLFLAGGEFLGTRCLLIPRVPPLDAKGYEQSRQCDEIVSPLPEKLLKMVQARLELQQKALQLRQEAARVNPPVEPEARAARVPFSLETLNETEIESLTVREFLQAIERTKNLKKLMLADDLAEQAVNATQKQIKKELKKPPHKIHAKGKINLNAVVQNYETQNKGTSSYGRLQARYIDATTGEETSKQIRPLTEEEIAERKRKQQSHQQKTSAAI